MDMNFKGPYRMIEGAAWPVVDTETEELEFRLRHDDASKPLSLRVRAHALSYVQAYRELVSMTPEQREAIIQEIRKGKSP